MPCPITGYGRGERKHKEGVSSYMKTTESENRLIMRMLDDRIAEVRKAIKAGENMMMWAGGVECKVNWWRTKLWELRDKLAEFESLRLKVLDSECIDL